MAASPCVNTHPVVEWRTAQSESPGPAVPGHTTRSVVPRVGDEIDKRERGEPHRGMPGSGSSWLCRGFTTA
eukprot:6208652-Pleurochrysis_carterae.AAC.1